ncbi:MAG TPA: hypothetical protein PKE00_07360, partial [Planctomycetota bacterium]|nr:hypothetical protein [Planctomycetota bacterium]
LGLACVLSLGLTLAHVVWSGQAAGTPGQDVVQKILRSFAPKRGFEPAWGTYFEAWVRALVDGLAWPGLVLAVLALLWLALHGRRGSAAYERRLGFGPGFGIGAFAFVGVLHCALFRAHFVLHDFWAFYLTPAAALASAAFAQRLTTLLRVALLLVVGGFGFAGSLAVWQERAAPPVREVAGDLAALADEATVFHQLRAPAGWPSRTSVAIRSTKAWTSSCTCRRWRARTRVSRPRALLATGATSTTSPARGGTSRGRSARFSTSSAKSQATPASCGRC